MFATKRLLLLVGAAFCLEAIPESVKIKYMNDKYVENVVSNVRRNNRKSPYSINLNGTLKHTWGNNITVHLVMTEYLHNEYRRSFIEYHKKMCDLINEEPYIGGMLRKKGIVCPVPKGNYELRNLIPDTSEFPNVWPFEKGGVNMEITLTETGECVVKAEVHFRFIQKKVGKKSFT